MKQVTKKIHCKLETLTPVHIGFGQELPSSEYLLYEKPLYERPEAETMGTLASQLAAALRDADAKPLDEDVAPSDRAFVAYDLRGYLQSLTPNERRRFLRRLSDAQHPFRLNDTLPPPAREMRQCWRYYTDISLFVFNELQESQLKSVQETVKFPALRPDEFDRIYLPGSTLKGGLRTALAHFLASNNLRLLARGIASSSGHPRQSQFDRFAFQSSRQQRHFSVTDVQSDILRCLEVSDSDAKPLTIETVEIYVVQTATFPDRRHLYFKNWQTFYEMIKPGQVFNFDIRLKTAMLNHSTVRDRLGWTPPADELPSARLPQILNEFALKTIDADIDYLATVPNARNLANAVHATYQSLKRQVEAAIEKNNGTCYLCIGRGAGRHKRTVELAIVDPEQPDLRFGLYGGKRDNGRLGDGRQGTGNLGRGDVRQAQQGRSRTRIAPVSRVFTMSEPNIAQHPLGWVKLTFGEGFEDAKSEILPIPRFQG